MTPCQETTVLFCGSPVSSQTHVSPCALRLELQRILKHRQEQLTQTLIVWLLKTHIFCCSKALRARAPLKPPVGPLLMLQ